MLEEVLKAIPVYFSSMLKFIFGPLGGFAAQLHPVTTIICTVAGMMTVVIMFAFFGRFTRRIFKRIMPNRKPSLPMRSERLIRIWKRYGLAGVAILTPLILTPIGGTILAISFGTPRNKLMVYMFVSAVFWAVAFTVTIYFFGNEMLPDFVK